MLPIYILIQICVFHNNQDELRIFFPAILIEHELIRFRLHGISEMKFPLYSRVFFIMEPSKTPPSVCKPNMTISTLKSFAPAVKNTRENLAFHCSIFQHVRPLLLQELLEIQFQKFPFAPRKTETLKGKLRRGPLMESISNPIFS